MDKKQVRRSLRIDRRAFPNEKRLEYSRQISERLFQSQEYAQAKAIMVYISTRIEVDTSLIVRQALADGKAVAAPRCKSKIHVMDFFVIKSTEDLDDGAYGLSEPREGCELFTAYEDSICIVPGLSFDTNGQRMGFGGGYYDRFLSDYSGISCGLCFDEFISDTLPTEETDVAVDMIVTQSKIIHN